MRKAVGKTIAKGLGLAALDAATVWLLFVPWGVQERMMRIPLLVFVFFSLFMLHLFALFPLKWKWKMHMRSSASLWGVSLVHFLLQLAAASVTGGGRGSGRWYLVLAMVLLALYIIVSISLYMSGRSEVLEKGFGPQGVTYHQVQMILLNMESAISALESLLEPRQYEALRRGYSSLREKIGFTTPFGRYFVPAVVEMEQAISNRLEELHQDLEKLSRLEDKGPTLEKIESEMQAILGLIRSREQLINQETVG